MNLAGIIEAACRVDPAAPALLAPGRPTLGYGALDAQLQRIGTALSHAGVARHDRVAIVLPNGPEMAVSALATACYAASAPLNPAYREEEFRFYLGDLRPKVLLLAKSDAGPARRVARELGIHCLDVRWESAVPAGMFDVSGAEGLAPAPSPPAGLDDVALILHTSGTTSRPKIVPLTHRNLVCSAANIASWLALQPEDRCLNLMPLFHIHGFVAALLASLHAGSSMACVPGMREGRFAEWIDELQPTWYTAVPSIHQAVLEGLAKRTTGPLAHRLRFVRSSSAPLPPRVASDLEAALGIPVIEAYGMTEAAHQIASNPLPPRVRKPGTVGLPAGPEIAVVDADGQVVGLDEAGEIAIRGENLTPGYVANPEANRAAFADGWFRTGDAGRMDADGYLTITGRLKEIVNRGGEKVAPREVDEALLAHPAVRQAVAFAAPHPTLGEDVAAAVVLKDGGNATGEELRRFLFERIADFKVPSRIVITKDIPTSATGKIQRLGLAAHFARELAVAMVLPADALETAVAKIFSEVLGTKPVGAAHNFFALGGDSLRGGQVLSRVQARLGVDLPPLALFRSPTVAEFAREIGARMAALAPAKRAAVEMQLQAGPGTGHALVARALRAVGATHLYTIPAVPIYETVGACAAEGMRVIGTRNQQNAALMAVAQNYVAGRQVAAVLVSSGVPASIALTGALVAQDNCWPLLILASAVARNEAHSGQFMSLDTPALYRSVTKSATTVRSAEEIPAAVSRAWSEATAGRPGAVLLELPADVLSERAHFLLPSTEHTSAPAIPASMLDEAAARLSAARKPLLLAGKGTRWANPFADLRALVDRAALPFVTSPIARGYLPDRHPLCCNDIGWAAQREADLVVLLGARLDWTFRYGTQINPDAAIIQVDIEAAEIGRNRPADLGVVGDAGQFLRGLLERISGSEPAAAVLTHRRGWIEDLARRREDTVRRRADAARSAAARISPQAFAAAVAAALPDDAFTVLDGNLVMAASQHGIPVDAPLSRLTPGSSGCMGTGIPFAIGAKLQYPDRPVVAICGDFAFGLSAIELETAIRHDVAIVVIVANNDGNSGALRQRTMFPAGHPERVAMFQPGIRYEKIVEAFGGHGKHVDRVEEIGPAIARALSCGKPACINVAIDPEAPFPRN